MDPMTIQKSFDDATGYDREIRPLVIGNDIHHEAWPVALGVAMGKLTVARIHR